MFIILIENRFSVFMNKILVMAKNKNTYFIKRLIETVGEEHVVLFDPWSELSPVDTDIQKILVRTTGVYSSNADLSYLKTQTITKNIINPLESLETFRSKLSQYKYFKQKNIPHFPWLNLQESELMELESFLKQYPAQRYLIKPHRGQGGWGIETFTSQEILTWFKTRKSSKGDLEYLLQIYYEDVIEVRFFFIGEDYSITLQREKIPGQAQANFGQGGEAYRVEDHPDFWRLVEKIRAELSLFYGAIDALLINGSPVILEVNATPGIEQLEQVSGQDVMQRLTAKFFGQ
jgi:glutathione synthase/RimK-type ligase-like ATP-grasp enzyme